MILSPGSFTDLLSLKKQYFLMAFHNFPSCPPAVLPSNQRNPCSVMFSLHCEEHSNHVTSLSSFQGGRSKLPSLSWCTSGLSYKAPTHLLLFVDSYNFIKLKWPATNPRVHVQTAWQAVGAQLNHLFILPLVSVNDSSHHSLKAQRESLASQPCTAVTFSNQKLVT